MANKKHSIQDKFWQFYLNKPKLQEDEHFISFLLKVGAVNGGYGKDINVLLNHLGFSLENAAFHPEKFNDPINNFLRILEEEETPLQFYLKSTEMKFLNLIEYPESIDHFWIEHYQSRYKPNSIYRKNMLFNMCEHCMKEEKDSGQLPMIHLSHQLPGVKVCPKHNAKLHQYYLKDMGRFPFGFEKYDEVDQTQLSDFDYRFAVFMCELSKLKMNYSLYDLISDINEKMNDKYAPYYLKETSDDQLVCLYNKYLCNGGFVLATNNVLDLFKLMYFIYHDPKNILIIPKNEHFKAFNDKIYGKYDLVGDYSESVVELRCLNCKETFITSPRLILNQHECPHCKALTQKYYYNLITHYVNNVYGGKYKFVRYDYKEQIVVVYHSKTGKTLNFDVFRFITKYLNRQNRKIIPIDYAWRRYSNYGTYDRYLKGEFLIRQASKEYFLNEMFDLVADEYQLVGEYENMFSEVELRHSLCGKVLRVKPYDFLNGKRCENCKVKHSAEVITDFLNRMIPGYHFISNYEHSINSYLFRAIQYKYSYRIASVERIYQFTEEILIQEILRINKKTQMFRTVKLNPVIFYEFFFQKDINTVSNGKEGEDGETYVP